MGADFTIKQTIGRDGGEVWLILEDGREIGSTPHGHTHAVEIMNRIKAGRKGSWNVYGPSVGEWPAPPLQPEPGQWKEEIVDDLVTLIAANPTKPSEYGGRSYYPPGSFHVRRNGHLTNETVYKEKADELEVSRSEAKKLYEERRFVVLRGGSGDVALVGQLKLIRPWYVISPEQSAPSPKPDPVPLGAIVRVGAKVTCSTVSRFRPAKFLLPNTDLFAAIGLGIRTIRQPALPFW